MKYNVSLVIVLMFHVVNCLASQKIPLCISLGGACSNALSLRSLNLRNKAFPFDWIITSYESLCHILQDDFKYFCTELSLLPNGCGVQDYYGVKFVHDFPTITTPVWNDLLNDIGIRNMDKLVLNWPEAIPAVLSKYVRRIDRFRNVCQGNKKIYFLRRQYKQGLSVEQACLLKDIIQKKYPALDFVLVIIVSNKDQFITEPLDNIRYFYAKSWNNVKEFKSILVKLDPVFERTTITRLYDDHCHEHCCIEAE